MPSGHSVEFFVEEAIGSAKDLGSDGEDDSGRDNSNAVWGIKHKIGKTQGKKGANLKPRKVNDRKVKGSFRKFSSVK